MTKEPIMIDDVDVYECEHLREEFTEFYLNDADIDYINYCCAYTNECKKYSDCYYKQLKRKEQECEKFKEENKLAKEIIKKAVVDFSIEYGTKQYGRLLNGAKLLGIEVLDDR